MELPSKCNVISEEVFDFTDKYVFWMFIVGALPSVLSQVPAHFARVELLHIIIFVEKTVNVRIAGEVDGTKIAQAHNSGKKNKGAR